MSFHLMEEDDLAIGNRTSQLAQVPEGKRISSIIDFFELLATGHNKLHSELDFSPQTCTTNTTQLK